MKVYAYEVTVKHNTGRVLLNARTAGHAKARFLNKISDVRPDIVFTAIRARRKGAPFSSPEFIRVAEKRGLPDVRCGAKVEVGGAIGIVVGHNSSMNFDVLFDGTSVYGGQVLNVHPASCRVLESRP